METVRGKFVVQKVTEFQSGQKEVTLSAQYSGNQEDNSYAQATPSGTIVMTISNPAAANFFTPGKKFYADFTACAE